MTIYFLIGAVMVFLLSDLSSISNEINKTNRKIDKIMSTLNISEYDYDLIDNELKNIISDKGKIKAIKRYREITGLGLKESKEYIDKLNEEVNL